MTDPIVSAVVDILGRIWGGEDLLPAVLLEEDTDNFSAELHKLVRIDPGVHSQLNIGTEPVSNQ